MNTNSPQKKIYARRRDGEDFCTDSMFSFITWLEEGETPVEEIGVVTLPRRPHSPEDSPSCVYMD